MMESGSIFGLLTIIPVLIYLFILGFTIYFIVKVLKFMTEKTKLDQQRNEKLDELIRAIQDNKSI
jgi:large-conductance mechanosensitive channel